MLQRVTLSRNAESQPFSRPQLYDPEGADMLVRSDERVPIARLLRFLQDGEYFASGCARAQTRLAPNPGVCRFLLNQARQESYHAFVFQANIG